MAAHTHSTALPFWPLTLMWFGMMAAMMAPAVWPWVRAFHRFDGAPAGSGAGRTARFASGYLIAWFGYAIGAALLQRALEAAALIPHGTDRAVPYAGAAILMVAGLYQFAPLKRACLTHCRTPFGYFLTRWRSGPIGALQMGLHHGMFCAGCCWALMATAFAVGVMNAWWMALLGALALAEQVAPYGQAVRRGTGVAFLIAGVVRLAAP
jgi:predicted metal-binding membrane protein